MPILKSIELFFQEGSHDKVYNAYLVIESDGTHSVNVEWGRRNAGFNTGKKAVHVSLGEANKVYDRVVREKTNKGYQEITKAVQPALVAPPTGQGSGSHAPNAAIAKPVVGMKAQLLTAIEDHEVEPLLADDGVIAQQKLDGIRIITRVSAGGMLASNRNGAASDKVSSAQLAGLAGLPEGTIVDGEVMPDGSYWLFDVLSLGHSDVTQVGYEDRWLILADELADALAGDIHVLAIARGKDKRALYHKLVQASAEGIVFKSRAAPYTAGRVMAQKKYKLQKSADVVITSNAGNAYAMALHHGGKLVHVGKVFAGTTNQTRSEIDDLLAAGDHPVAEVRYLYATDDDQLFQPVFVRVRDDKAASACLSSQLKKTNKAVIT
ncbi:MAG TPA: hypothetical protein VGO62_06460 [Myxococcota bacterium]|jgi:bifunctional non-homologous end joining protein LigD